MNLARTLIKNLKAYSPPVAGRTAFNGLLLDFNERSDSPDLKSNNRYPEYGELRAELAAYCSVGQNQILPTNGSDQAIDVVFRTFVDAGDKVVILSPTFGMIEQAAQLAGAEIFEPLYTQPDLAFPIEEVLAQDAKLIVLCNPNSPTGTLLTAEQIAAIAKAKPQTLIMVDEAYFEFSGVTAAGLIEQCPNVVVTRTFSKAFGLAGLRLGYVIASNEHIAEMRKVCGPYSVSNVAQAAGLRALKNRADMENYVAEVMKKAKPLVESFFAQNNIPFWPSAGNFILFRPANWQQVLKDLEQRGMLVRPQDRPGTPGCLRVTITTKQEMQRFIATYQQILKENMKKIAFVDRDGTLIFEPQDTYQIDSLEKLQILPGVIEGLQALQKAGYSLVLISNQDGLGTASFPQADFDAPQQKMLEIFAENDITFDEVFICPHLPEDNCVCRKPKTGLVKDFLASEDVDYKKSLVCGDRPTDAAFAKNISVRYVDMPTNGNFFDALRQASIV